MQIGLQSLMGAEAIACVEECQQFYASRGARSGPRDREELNEARAKLPGVVSASGPPPVHRLIEAGGRRVPVRILVPESEEPHGVFVEIHAGGFYMGSAADGDARNRRLADALQVAVVSVDYRLAPEHPWPAAPDDCETAALWLLDQAEVEFGTTRLAIGGASAGATLALTTLLRLRDRGVADSFAGGALQFGTYDLSGQTPASRLIADEYFIEAYAGHVTDRTKSDISPIYGDMRGLPPTLLVVGARDILLEDNLAMAARLSAAGGSVDVRVYPECPHGFTFHPTPMAGIALSDIDAWLANRFSSTHERGQNQQEAVVTTSR
jgi:acetyl esterase